MNYPRNILIYFILGLLITYCESPPDIRVQEPIKDKKDYSKLGFDGEEISFKASSNRVIEDKYNLKVMDRKKGKQQCVEAQCRLLFSDTLKVNQDGRYVVERSSKVDCTSSDNIYYEEVATINYNLNNKNALYTLKDISKDGENPQSWTIKQAIYKSQYNLLAAELKNAYGIMDPFYEVVFDTSEKGDTSNIKACVVISARGVEISGIASNVRDEPQEKKKGK